MAKLYGVALKGSDPVSGVSVSLTSSSGSSGGEMNTDAEGAFSFDVSPGEWKLNWKSGGDSGSLDVTVPEDGDAEVEIEV